MKKTKLAILLGLASATVLLAGCDTGVRQVHLNLKYLSQHSAPLNSKDANAQAEVATAATSTSGSLQELAAMHHAEHPQDKLGNPIDPQTTGMTGLASIDWDGPVQPIVQRLADAASYRLRVLGESPAIPVLVTVDMQNQPIADILRNVMYQAENKAVIKVYPKSRVIELRYLPA